MRALRIILRLSCIYAGYGISTTWTIWFESAGFELRHRDVWRRNGVLQGMGCERRGGGNATGRHLPRGRRQSIRYGGYLFRRALRDYSGQGDRRATGESTHLDEGNVPHGAGTERPGIVAPSLDPGLRRQLAATGDGLHRHLSPAWL